MAIHEENPVKLHTFTGPGSYDLTFTVYDALDVQAVIKQSGVEYPLVNGTDFLVTPTTENSVASVFVTSEEYAASGAIQFTRNIPFTQPTEWNNGSNLDMRLLDRSFDRSIMLLQQMSALLGSGLSALQWLGDWVAGVEYATRSLVQAPDDDWYYCSVAHTSGVFATDFDTGYWVLFLSRSELTADLILAEEYANQAVVSAAEAYESRTGAEIAASLIVPLWEDAPTSYSKPDLVVGSDGILYRCMGVDVVGVDPVTSSGPEWIRATPPAMPVGSIIAYMPGYFTGSGNSGFTPVVTNTVGGVNAAVNADGFYVCDGSEINVASSPFFNGVGRCLPDLTDSRFVMGSTSAGGVGGDSTMAHTHSGPSHTHTTGNHTLTTAQIPSHNHEVNVGTSQQRVGYNPDGVYVRMTGSTGTTSTGGGGAHNHGNTGSSGTGTTSAASYTENRPKFLACYYIMKVV